MKLYPVILFFVFLFSCLPVLAAEEHICTNGDAIRVISVSYEDDQTRVPCEVHYDKGEGVKVLWNAQSEVGYCENKAKEFVEKQESLGWSCKVNPQDTIAEDRTIGLF